MILYYGSRLLLRVLRLNDLLLAMYEMFESLLNAREVCNHVIVLSLVDFHVYHALCIQLQPLNTVLK